MECTVLGKRKPIACKQCLQMGMNETMLSNFFLNNLEAETCLVQVWSESYMTKGLDGLLIWIFCWCLFPCCLTTWFTVQEKYWLKYFRVAAWSKDPVVIWLAWDKLAGFFSLSYITWLRRVKSSFFLNVSGVHKWLRSHHDNMGTWIRLSLHASAVLLF